MSDILAAAIQSVGGADGFIRILRLASAGESPSILIKEWDINGGDPSQLTKILTKGTRTTQWDPQKDLLAELAQYGITRCQNWHDGKEQHAHALNRVQASISSNLLDLADVFSDLAVEAEDTVLGDVISEMDDLLNQYAEHAVGTHPQVSPLPGWALESILAIAEGLQALTPLLTILSPDEASEGLKGPHGDTLPALADPPAPAEPPVHAVTLTPATLALPAALPALLDVPLVGLGLPIKRATLPLGAHARPWVTAKNGSLVAYRFWGGHPPASRIIAAEVCANGTLTAYSINGTPICRSRWEGDPIAACDDADDALVKMYGASVFGLGIR